MVDKQIIICVDDEQIVLTSLVAQLRRSFGRRFDYETFTCAEEALEYVDELYADGESIALIVTDWLMPKVRGDQFLVNVKRRYDDVPMIMLSGQADDAAVNRAKTEANLFKFIGKPWQVEELTQQAALAMGFSLSDNQRPSAPAPVERTLATPQPVSNGQQSKSATPMPMFAKRKTTGEALTQASQPATEPQKRKVPMPFMLAGKQQGKS